LHEIFNLPDLGEGLAEAEIVRWHVNTGDYIKADDPMLAVETAKAIVEVPAPFSGVIKATTASQATRLPQAHCWLNSRRCTSSDPADRTSTPAPSAAARARGDRLRHRGRQHAHERRGLCRAPIFDTMVASKRMPPLARRHSRPPEYAQSQPHARWLSA